MEKDFKFINQKDIYQYKFYMIPKELFVNERYISLSPAAILLYGILLDRLTLSIKNNWVDKNGNIYLIFTRKEIESILHISDKTCTKTFKELVDAKLLLEKSQGKAKPKLLYPAQMVHDEKFDNLIRKNSDSQGVNSTTHESENLRPNDTNNKNTNKTNKNYCNYEQRQYTKGSSAIYLIKALSKLLHLTLTGKKWKYTYVIQLYQGLYMCIFLPKVVAFSLIFLLFLKFFLYLVKFGFLMRNQCL